LFQALSSNGTLTMRGNHLTRLMIGEALAQQIRRATPTPNAILVLRRLYRTCFLTNNVFETLNNEFLQRQLIMTSNSFNVRVIVNGSPAPLGIVMGESAIYTGNQSLGSVTIFSLTVNPLANAANLVNINQV